MNITACLAFAGMKIAVTCTDPRLPAAIARHYPAFIIQPCSNPTLNIIVHITGNQRNDPARDPQAYFDGSKMVFDSPGYQGQIDLFNGYGELSFSSRNPFLELDLLLRIASSLWAIEQGGVQLHCAAIYHHEFTHVFFGHSGSGKTTTARLSCEKTVLNDDLNMILPLNGQWEVHATPYWNPTQARPNNFSAPLASLYRLVQSPQHNRRDMEPPRALAELISCTPVLKIAPTLLPDLTQNLHSLLSIHPCYWLEFRKDAGFWGQVV
jgi:hypothetical protein